MTGKAGQLIRTIFQQPHKIGVSLGASFVVQARSAGLESLNQAREQVAWTCSVDSRFKAGGMFAHRTRATLRD